MINFYFWRALGPQIKIGAQRPTQKKEKSQKFRGTHWRYRAAFGGRLFWVLLIFDQKGKHLLYLGALGPPRGPRDPRDRYEKKLKKYVF